MLTIGIAPKNSFKIKKESILWKISKKFGKFLVYTRGTYVIHQKVEKLFTSNENFQSVFCTIKNIVGSHIIENLSY